jgi:long-chain acyl-CoA synthetase
VFSKVKARLGGRVRILVSGGAPLAPHVEEFLKVAFCCPVVQVGGRARSEGPVDLYRYRVCSVGRIIRRHMPQFSACAEL